VKATRIATAGLALLALAAAPLARPALAQDSTAAAPAPCSGPEYRQFDFWLGDWEVTGPKGGVVGTNLVERVQGDCGLRENWAGKGGITGTSLNIWNAEDGRWHQTWIDSTGGLLLLSGGLVNGAMVMSGTTKSTAHPGGTTLQRITWTPNADGTVRQLWEASEDDGTTWTVAFDGLYTKKK